MSGCHYHDLELASAGDGDAGDAGGGGGERARRLDFQAKRAVGGHKERLLAIGLGSAKPHGNYSCAMCLACISTNVIGCWGLTK